MYCNKQASEQIREAQDVARAGQQPANRRQREDEDEDEGDDEDESEAEDGIPASWRDTLAQDALRQAITAQSGTDSLSECYLSGSLSKASKRQRVTSPTQSLPVCMSHAWFYLFGQNRLTPEAGWCFSVSHSQSYVA